MTCQFISTAGLAYIDIKLYTFKILDIIFSISFLKKYRWKGETAGGFIHIVRRDNNAGQRNGIDLNSA